MFIPIVTSGLLASLELDLEYMWQKTQGTHHHDNARVLGSLPELPSLLSAFLALLYKQCPGCLAIFRGGCCLIAKLCLAHCSSVDCSTPGFPAFLYLPEFA